MIANQSALTEREQQLGQIVFACVQALEEGQVLDREALLARYPDWAAELSAFFAGREQIDRLAAPLRQLAEAARAVSPTPNAHNETPSASYSETVLGAGPLGDYRLLREIGRGGMGIVYEAEQISLGRRVALKVLPFAATMDHRHLQRFHNEARAAASLEHPHIVPVYGVGCERGVHFYAMKFIDGQSLANLFEHQRAIGVDFSFVRKKRAAGPTSDDKRSNNAVSRERQHSDAALHQGGEAPCSPESATAPVATARTERSRRDTPTFRQIAEWGVQAAEALEHAHSVGIVHRDVKPANLMVDARSLLWVTDFGLARTAGDAGLTMTGDVLGTLRYMSPEQALAKHGLVDHRTDIYSLGVTLYELLTGSPAVGGVDREHILNVIMLEEPPPPRARVAAIPIDLETIVLKAISKNPDDRYATAQEMANDLRRFLDDKPVQARRPGWIKRSAKWVRRHRTMMTFGVAASSVTAVMLIIGLLWHNAELQAAAGREAEQARQALMERNQAREQGQRAEAERRAAELNMDMALNGMCELLRRLYGRECADIPRVSEVQRVLTESTSRFYQSLSQDGNDDRVARYQTARAYLSLGNLHATTGDQTKALEATQKAVTLFKALTRDYPTDAFYWNQLGYCHGQLCGLHSQMSEPKRAAEQLRMATSAFEQASLLDPNDWRFPNNVASMLLASNEPAVRTQPKAVEMARKAVYLDPGIKDNWNTLGIALYYAGDWRGAIEALQQALRLRPTALAYRCETDDCMCRFFLAMSHWRLGNKPQAREMYGDAVEWLEKNRYDNLGLRRFQTEAAEVLGIKVK
jgi:serine/threonine protein kinase/Flp pilus assembly protein TadD